MTKPDVNSFDPFEGWPKGLRRNVDLIGGSPLAYLILATMHVHADETFTSGSLRKRFEQKQGSSSGLPTISSFLHAIRRLGVETNLLDINHYPNGRIDARISRQGQALGAAFAGTALRLLVDNPGFLPQNLIGQGAKTKRTAAKTENHYASSRIGVYTLMDTTTEPFTLAEIGAMFKTEPANVWNMIRPLGNIGILDVQKAYREPFTYQISDQYREPIGEFTTALKTLETPAGIIDSLDVAEAVVHDAATFAYVMSLRQK